MHTRWIIHVTMGALCLVVVRPAGSNDSRESDDPVMPLKAACVSQDTQQAVERALEFLEKDAAKWRKERGCATCHHGTMTVWALSEARSQGHTVNVETLEDTVRWTKDQFVPRFNKPRDPRPGWNLVSIPAIYLGVMAQSLPILTRDEINQIAVHLARHQEEDGAWLMPPAANGAPPTWESRETLALWALLAWEPSVPADPQEAAAARVNREKATKWLSENKPTETTQSIGLRLLVDLRTGKSAEECEARINWLLSRQNSDGGWSQVTDSPSDAYATGQALWVLSFAGVKQDRPEIGRAVSFLVANQREDGSWPMTCRSHPGVDTTRQRNPVPITYFGSAWATLGLVRSSPPALDLAARQQRAFDSIRAFGGTFELDEASPGKPVVSVKVVYEVDDQELMTLTPLLTAFPDLKTLQFKSARITDAGLVSLNSLAQLQSLSLENAAVTDAGLVHLKPLTHLEELNLKGTNVTDVGVQDFQTAMPRVKVVR
ncbi:MAG: prenyltransferase/squalene oxidase repeat-containing protein [Pirellulales bacterium]